MSLEATADGKEPLMIPPGTVTRHSHGRDVPVVYRPETQYGYWDKNDLIK